MQDYRVYTITIDRELLQGIVSHLVWERHEVNICEDHQLTHDSLIELENEAVEEIVAIIFDRKGLTFAAARENVKDSEGKSIRIPDGFLTRLKGTIDVISSTTNFNMVVGLTPDGRRQQEVVRRTLDLPMIVPLTEEEEKDVKVLPESIRGIFRPIPKEASWVSICEQDEALEADPNNIPPAYKVLGGGKSEVDLIVYKDIVDHNGHYTVSFALNGETYDVKIHERVGTPQCTELISSAVRVEDEQKFLEEVKDKADIIADIFFPRRNSEVFAIDLVETRERDKLVRIISVKAENRSNTVEENSMLVKALLILVRRLKLGKVEIFFQTKERAVVENADRQIYHQKIRPVTEQTSDGWKSKPQRNIQKNNGKYNRR